jgi:hypothetical protein
LFLLAPILFLLHIAESVLFGFEEAFQDYTRRLASVQRRFANRHTLFAVLIGVVVITWMVTVYLASLGGVWWHFVTLAFGILLLAELEHPIRAAAVRRYYCGLFTGTLLGVLGLALIIQSLNGLR